MDTRETDHAALDKLRADFASAFNSSNPEAVANIYAMDAVLMPPGESAAVGRAAIQSYFKEGFDQFATQATLASQEFGFAGADWAFDRGTYAVTIAPKAGGNPATQEYKYLTLLQSRTAGK